MGRKGRNSFRKKAPGGHDETAVAHNQQDIHYDPDGSPTDTSRNPTLVDRGIRKEQGMDKLQDEHRQNKNTYKGQTTPNDERKMDKQHRTRSSRKKMYVDFSGDDEGNTGIGIYIREGQPPTEKIKTPRGINTDIGELLAVLAAIRVANERGYGSITISTDRKEITQILRTKKIRTKIVGHILQEIEKRTERGEETQIIFEQGHNENNTGNKEAHRVAREARTDGREDRDEHNNYKYRGKKDRKKERIKNVMERWQEEWNNETKGRELYKVCKEVGQERLDLNFKACQLVTGHGNLNSYLSRFRLQEISDRCSTDMEEKEDCDHVKVRCTKVKRVEARRRIMEKYGDLNLNLRINNKKNEQHIEKANWWAEEAIE